MIPAQLIAPPASADATWSESLYCGAPGLALLHAEHAHATGGPATLHPWARAMTTHPVNAHCGTGLDQPSAAVAAALRAGTAHRGTGLYQGAPAVAVALRAALIPGHPSHAAYSEALAHLDTQITRLVHARLAQARDRLLRDEPPQLAEYDLIRGLTGLGAYLLHRDPDDPALADVLTYLVTLTRPLRVDGHTVPGWWTSTAPNGFPSADWPDGHANFGISHGVAGPLALLALAHRHGVIVKGHAEAIARILETYDAHQLDANGGPWWPATVSSLSTPPEHDHPGPPSWCYGTPGIARAQQLAGLALGDRARAAAAEHALAASLRDPEQLARLTGITLCHGLAGAVLTAWRAAADADGGGPLDNLVPGLRARLADSVDVEHPAALAPGLLDGLAGVVLTLHATGRDEPPPTQWDHWLLIAG